MRRVKPRRCCSICGAEYSGYGHNAAPVKEGRCCDHCNAIVVLPARLAIMRSQQESEEME
jgi:hypothetical protein